jgi:Actin and related proteins
MEWEANKNYRVVVDNGSHHIRMGMASSNTPQLVYQNITGIS